MAIHESKGIKGWIAFISSGVTLGLIVGILLLNYVDENWIVEFLISTSILGGFLGFFSGSKLVGRKTMEESFEDVYRSKDLDSFYRSSLDPASEKDFRSLIAKFNDEELITAITMRYYKLSDETTDKLINEFRHRKLRNSEIERLYTSKKYYSVIAYERCPGCNSKDYLIKRDNKITNCLVCGFDIEFDNPNSVMNRIRWKLGVHSNSKLSLDNLLSLIVKTS